MTRRRPETTYWQYTTGVKDTSLVSPDGYNLDNYYMTRRARMRLSWTCSSTTRAMSIFERIGDETAIAR